MKVEAASLSVQKIHQLLLGAIGPRPICFASTVDSEGRRNLAPFSFFNVFSANPPIVVFSPARSGRDGSNKHTYENVLEVPQVVINVVNYNMVHQTSLASSPFAKGVDEFEKAGFTPLPSESVKPWRVAESPVQMECDVLEVRPLGDGGGSGNLVICQVKLIHVHDDVLDADGRIDQTKIDLVARMGGDWYCRAHGDALFSIAKPLTTVGLGVDALPDHIRLSHKLTGNHLGMLGNQETWPSEEEIQAALSTYGILPSAEDVAIRLLDQGEARAALCVLLGSV
ncbi:MAG: flavin reductase family protein [Bacteroidetes bacterium]|nr:flavin reductase family protein [Bacteroidota bacterium]